MPIKINTKRSAGENVVKEGIYQLVVTAAEEKTSASGNDMIQLQLARIRNGRPFGRTIFDNLVFAFDDEGNNKAQFRFDQFHDALEVEEDMEITCKWYKGKKVYAYLITDAYGGNVNNKVKNYLPPEVALDLLEKQAASDEDEDELASIPDDTHKPPAPAASNGTAKRGRPRIQAAASVAEMEDSEDDDIPF